MTKAFYAVKIINMKSISKFQRAVAQTRKELKEAGIPPATIHTWENGTVPMYETALKIAPILGLNISDIPFIMIMRNL